MNFVIGISIHFFQRRPPESLYIRPINGGVECFVCDGWKPRTMHIFNLASLYSVA